jgi:EAL domain-containing protein (putative c-di-GMP-specific phosphodiesterase class I)
MESFNVVVEKLKLLKGYGFQIHLDDFGTGYSSLNYLKNLPINSVKIDKSFIDGITGDGVERMLVQSIIQMAHNLGLHVVAEGVETNEQLEYLSQSHCNYFQGYLASRPVPEDEASKLLQGKGLESEINL